MRLSATAVVGELAAMRSLSPRDTRTNAMSGSLGASTDIPGIELLGVVKKSASDACGWFSLHTY